MPISKPEALRIIRLLRPHWKAMTIGLAAVGGATIANLLEPWPIKIVLDYVLQSKPLPGWVVAVVGWIGEGKPAILSFALAAVAAIAVAGAASSYAEKYVTSSVGQWIMHDLRRTVYHHIHRLSLAEHDEKRTGDLIGRVTKDIESIQDFVTSALLGIVTSVLTLAGIIGVMLYMKLAVHADLALHRAFSLSRGLLLHAEDQKSIARRQEKRERTAFDHRRSILIDSRGESLCPRGV